MKSLLEQLKERRLSLDLKQSDMMLRTGISRQQYQRLESKGNPRLDTLELIAQGFNSELVLIPKEKLAAVKALLESDATATTQPLENKTSTLSDAPWQDLLGDES